MQRMTPPRGMVPLGPQVWDQMICGDVDKMLGLMVILLWTSQDILVGVFFRTMEVG